MAFSLANKGLRTNPSLVTIQRIMNTQVIYKNRWPSKKELGPVPIIIYDSKILKSSKEFKTWIESFEYTYKVQGGEKLKDLRFFPNHMEKILKLVTKIPPKEMTIVAVGGGSVGDFAGLVASLLKRGIHWIQIPSTWLAAIDSAHGGKTALNIRGIKNQIGSFHFPQKVFIIKNLLYSLPKKQCQQAYGELYKMALLEKGKWSQDVIKLKSINPQIFWKTLPFAIKSKYKIIKKDPFEKTGYRRILNLGHTLGHIIEGHYHISHGEAVSLGLEFSLEWSLEKEYISPIEQKKTASLNDHNNKLKIRLQKMPLTKSQFLKLASQDKKLTQLEKVDFVFLKKRGETIRKQVNLLSFMKMAQKSGWVK